MRRPEHARVEIDSLAAWRDWLARHHAQPDGIWLVTWKRGDPRYVPYADLRDEALCFGWIDSLPRKLDDRRTMLRMSPRRGGSRWSAINKERVAELTRSGRMAAPGLDAVAAAKRDSGWTALDRLDEVPGDLAAALDAATRPRFDALAPSLRRGLLETLIDAKRPATRARRIAAIVDRCRAT